MKLELQESIDKQINKTFGNLSSCYTTKVSFILSQLDLSLLLQEIKIRKTFYSMDSFLKLYLYKRIKGIKTLHETLETLRQNQKEAFNLRFFKDDNKIILPSKRNVNKFFQRRFNGELILLLDKIAEKILAKATQQGIILDIEIVKNHIKRKKKDHKKITHEAIRLIKKLIYPQIEIKINHNAKFTTRDLLDVLVHVAQTHDFTNNGSLTFKEIYPDKEVPHANTILYHFNKFNNIEQIREMYRRIFDVIFNFAKSNYTLLRRRKLDIAIDIHNIPYYGDKNDPFVKASKHERGTNQFIQFLTCNIAVNGKNFTIDAIPILPLDNLEDLLEELIIRAKNKININYAYLDRNFDKPKLINLLKKHNIHFIMPKIRSSTVKQYMDKYEDCKAKIVENFEIGKDENKATTKLVLVDDEEGIKRCFITNISIPEQLAHYLYMFYSKRWYIETSYRNLEHDFKPRTTSKNYCIRLFYFLFSVCLYNLWVLTNICVSLNVYNRVPTKPIITAKLFCLILHRVQVEYVDPGG